MSNIQTINFNNQKLLTVEKDGTKYVAVKPICENLGIDWDSQRVKIKSNPILNSTTAIITVVAEDGKLREMVCLPIDMINGWLFTINLNKVSEEIRPVVFYYQKECYRALFEFWNKPKEAILPSTYIEALEALVASEKEKLLLQKENEEMKPKEQFYNKLVQKGAMLNATELAKSLSIKRKDLIDWLLDNNWFYRDQKGSLQAYQHRIKSGHLTSKVFINGDKTGVRPLITPKGIELLIYRLYQAGLLELGNPIEVKDDCDEVQI